MKKYILLSLIAAFMLPSVLMAGPKEDVQGAFSRWRQALSSGKADNVVTLYDTDAILLATLSATPLTTQQERRDYFTKLTARPKLAVTVDKEYLKVLDDTTAVISGLYTFHFEENGNMMALPARYTFVYEKKNGQWLITDHHSSKLPRSK